MKECKNRHAPFPGWISPRAGSGVVKISKWRLQHVDAVIICTECLLVQDPDERGRPKGKRKRRKLTEDSSVSKS